MNHLIPSTTTTINARTVEAINARDLHAVLAPHQTFRKWIVHRINSYEFDEGVDYKVYAEKFAETPQGGRPTKNYALTINMAKEICMLERSQTGRKFRRYFIGLEKDLIEKGYRLEETEGKLEVLTTEIMKRHPMWKKIHRYSTLGLNQAEIAMLCKVKPNAIRKHRRKMEACGLINPPANLKRMQQTGQKYLKNVKDMQPQEGA